MKTKLLYVLVSGPGDMYLEQAFISAASARKHNPEARIELLTDSATFSGISSRGQIAEDFLKLFDNIVRADLDPSLPGFKRSRLLKTGMRSYIEGDFLYIDSDTVIAKALDAIDGIDASIAACADLHCTFADHPHRDATISLCRKAGFDASSEQVYFNGGVMLVRDTPEASEFFRLWHENYLLSYDSGIRQDQPSLSRTNASLGHIVKELEGFWNCQLQYGTRFLKDAYIVHYVCTYIHSGEEGKLFRLNDPSTLLKVRTGGLASVEDIIEDPSCGIAPCARLFAGEDLYFFRTRRYRWMRKRFRRNRFSLLEFILKVCDHIKSA